MGHDYLPVRVKLPLSPDDIAALVLEVKWVARGHVDSDDRTEQLRAVIRTGVHQRATIGLLPPDPYYGYKKVLEIRIGRDRQHSRVIKVNENDPLPLEFFPSALGVDLNKLEGLIEDATQSSSSKLEAREYWTVTGPEFCLIDQVLGVSSFYLHGKGEAAEYGARLSIQDVAVKRLLNRKLASVRADGMILFDYPRCKVLHEAILSDTRRGLLHRLLVRLATASDAPGKKVDPDGINGELGINSWCFAPYHALIQAGLISRHLEPHKSSGANYSITVTDEARLIAKQFRPWALDAVEIQRNTRQANLIFEKGHMNTIHDHKCAIFINYAHADNEGPDPKKHWLDRFLQMLKPLVNQQELSHWSDKEIKTGDNWHDKIQAQLLVAKAAVLLVSPAFLASDYIRNSELPVLLKNAAERGVKIFPIIIKPCLFLRAKFKYPDPTVGPHTLQLSQIQSANPPSQSLEEMSEGQQDRVLLKVAEELHDLLAPTTSATSSTMPARISPLAIEILDSAIANNGQLNYIRHDNGLVLLAKKPFDSAGDGRREAELDEALDALVQNGFVKKTGSELCRVTSLGYNAAVTKK